jgi:dolichyl-phosphate-mannose--protein O-mannosyl transferase
VTAARKAVSRKDADEADKTKIEPGPAPPRGVLAYFDLKRIDLIAIVSLTAIAFVIRFFSPFVISAPWDGPVISNCVHNTPVNAQGRLGTLCGLAYPYQRGYPEGSASPQPPEGQVFDEIYFGVFAHNDLKGIDYFDPEPPLSKLVIAAGEWGYGWWRATFEGAQGNYADLGFNTFGWRIAVCIVGTLAIPLMYLLARKLVPHPLFAFLAASMACFDGMFFIQSRVGMIDIVPIFLILLAYWVFLIHLSSRGPTDSLVTLALVGTCLGLAVASKWIALAAWASIIFFLVARPIRRAISVVVSSDNGRPWVWDRPQGPALPGGPPALAYVAVGIVFLVAVPILIYIGSWAPFFQRGQFHNMADLWAYQVSIYRYHADLTATHPYGSPWFSWPFLYRPVAYYFNNQGLGFDPWSGRLMVAGMANLGNPWIWWTSIPCLLALPYFIFRYRSFPATLIAVGFITQYLPWARITRVLFLYHMFGGLIFMILALAFVLYQLARHDAELRIGSVYLGIRGRELVYVHLALVVLFFIYFYPLWTALPITDQAYLNNPPTFPPGRMWFPSWI